MIKLYDFTWCWFVIPQLDFENQVSRPNAESYYEELVQVGLWVAERRRLRLWRLLECLSSCVNSFTELIRRTVLNTAAYCERVAVRKVPPHHQTGPKLGREEYFKPWHQPKSADTDPCTRGIKKTMANFRVFQIKMSVLVKIRKELPIQTIFTVTKCFLKCQSKKEIVEWKSFSPILIFFNTDVTNICRLMMSFLPSFVAILFFNIIILSYYRHGRRLQLKCKSEGFKFRVTKYLSAFYRFIWI